MKLHPLTGRLVALVAIGSISGITWADTAARPAHSVDDDSIVVVVQKKVVPTTATVPRVSAQPALLTPPQSGLCYSSLTALKSGGARRNVPATDVRFRCRNCSSSVDRHYVRHHYFW